ncbi:hypothetical protein [Nigerium massiliense]|nr:hypothetical protein [Nigerium massiliense]
MADILSLQGIEVDLIDTPADVYCSTNSMYACAPRSTLSISC